METKGILENWHMLLNTIAVSFYHKLHIPIGLKTLR